ncbi:MAG: zinc ribbon domain-containing protein [Acetivibrio sp.]
MYCSKCGKEISDDLKYCSYCGERQEIKENVKKNQKENFGIGQGKEMKLYISLGISGLNCILLFFNWMKIPMMNGISNFFNGNDSGSSFSFFGYIFSLNSNTNDSFIVAIVVLVLGILGLLSIILNIAYIVSTLKQRQKHFKYGTIASWILCILSSLFLLIAGLSTAILKVMKMTFAPWLVFALSIANIVLIKKLKKQKQSE